MVLPYYYLTQITIMTNLRFFMSFVCILVLFSCSKNKDVPNPCGIDLDNDLVLTIQNEYTTLPAKVSVFFKVDDKLGNPIPGLISSDFTIYEKGRNDACERKISSFEANATISSRKQIFAYNTVLVLDLSGSVTATSLEELKTAAQTFIEEIIPDDNDESYTMGIWWFDGSDQLHSLIPVTSNKEALKTAIENINANISNDPSTDLYGAVIKSVEQAEQLLTNAEQQDVISAISVVVFTDGTDQAGRYLKNNAYSAVNAASNGIKFFTIGLGGEIDEDVLNRVGTDGFVFASDQTQLEQTFQEVGQTISAEANSYYLFEYCSPKRDGSGRNKLRILANSNGNVGSVLTEFDATGFTGGCQ